MSGDSRGEKKIVDEIAQCYIYRLFESPGVACMREIMEAATLINLVSRAASPVQKAIDTGEGVLYECAFMVRDILGETFSQPRWNQISRQFPCLEERLVGAEAPRLLDCSGDAQTAKLSGSA